MGLQSSSLATHTPYAVDAIPTPIRIPKRVDIRERDVDSDHDDEVVARALQEGRERVVPV